jgi:hypothetical protein
MTSGRLPISRFPSLVREWHPTKNGAITPADVTAGSQCPIVWRCFQDPTHEWEAQVDSRAKGHGCPFCSGRRATAEECLAADAPTVAREWHPTKNGSLTPRDVRRASNKIVWWKCSRGTDHEWTATVVARAVHGVQCPACAGRQLSVSNALSRVAPAIAAQWHPWKNDGATPDTEIATAWQKRWWSCPVGLDHVWQEFTYTRVTRERGCPFCANARVSVTNSLAVRAPRVAEQWHPTRNGDMTPRDVVPGSSKHVWWKCPEGPDHEWRTNVANRAVTGSGCPFCDGKRVSVTNALATRAPGVAAQWHPTKNGKLATAAVHVGSSKSAWWTCEIGHVWRARIAHRTGLGSGCPTCEILQRRGRAPATRRVRRVAVRLPTRR